MEALKVAPVQKKDLPLLVELSEETFAEAFAKDNKPENLRIYMEKAFSPSQLKWEWKDSASFFYLLWKQDIPIGYIKINFGKAQTEFQNEESMEIERLYVLKAFWGKGASKKLMELALQEAKRHNVQYIWLGVWEHNPRAIRFYEKNGFTTFGSHRFQLGNDVQRDILMQRVMT